jgi:UDP-glucose:(heptosyl)LPS alpha-1,3-glucosyltransferase
MWTIQLAKWLLNRGHRVDIYCLSATKEVGLERATIQLIPSHRGQPCTGSLDAKLRSSNYDIIHNMGVGNHFNIFQPHFGSLQANKQAKASAYSPIRSHLNRLIYPFRLRKQDLKKQESTLFSHPTTWYIAVSNKVCADLCSLEQISKDRVFTISNGVDTSRFHPDAIAQYRESNRRSLRIDSDSLTISVIAHNRRLKGVPQLIKFLRDAKGVFDKVHLLIVGGSRTVDHPRTKRVGRHFVTDLGFIRNPISILAATDIYVHPTFYDACSLTVLEAMACGLPVITTRMNGASERISNAVNGFVIDSPNDRTGMMHAIHYLQSKEQRRQIGESARQEALRWTVEDNFQAIEMLYFARLEYMDASPENRQRIIHSGVIGYKPQIMADSWAA